MIRYENDCVGCPQGCIHCGRKHSPHIYCDICGGELSYQDSDASLDKDYHVCDECKSEEEEEE